VTVLPQGLERLEFPPGDALAAVAQVLVRRYGQHLPDLSAVTLIVPSLQAVPDIARALSYSCGGAPLLLPDITTFSGLSRSQPLPPPAVSDVRRELTLFDALRRQSFLEPGLLWRAAGELRQLADDLTAYRCRLADTLDAFTTQIEKAYGRSFGMPLGFEARIVHEAWRQLAGENDAGFRHQAGLAHAARHAQGPLWVIGCGPLRPVEAECLSAWNERFPVVVAEPVADVADGIAAMVASAFDGMADRPLAARARDFASRCPASPASTRIALCGAPTLESHAEAAELRIRAWLTEGVRRIAVVSLDRLVARRLRARLERSGVLMQDESGWALSTVAAATVVARWLDCVGRRFRHRDLVDLLTSPAVFSDWDEERRRRCAWRVEQILRDANIAGGLDTLAKVASRTEDVADVLAAVDRLALAARPLEGARTSAAQWVIRLMASLQALGIEQALDSDIAGRQVLEHLRGLGRDLSDDNTRLSLAEWREWLDAGFEAALFRDRDIRSPVVLTHLGAMRMREFDAVLLLGADAKNLPPSSDAGLFFNDAVRSELGLPTGGEAREQMRNDLLLLLCGSPQVFVTWQSREDGETAPLSPWLDVFDAFHQMAYGESLRDDRWVALAAAAGIRVREPSPLPPVSLMPGPAVGTTLPDRVSVSAYRAIITCPYQFFARHVLALRTLDEVEEALDKRDFGELLHRALLQFHRRVPRVSDVDPGEAERELLRATDDVFEVESERDPLAHAWAIRWRRRIPSYLVWQRLREAEGWLWSEGEVPAETVIVLDDGTHLILHGRLDRVDRLRVPDDGDVFSVLDYKAQRKGDLDKLLSQRDDVQLSCYALLREDVEQFGFVAIDDEVTLVEPARAPAAAAEAERERIASVFSAVRAGAPLVAIGDTVACTYCEMGGLCRRQHWEGA